MSQYPNRMNVQKRIAWGDFEIAVRTGAPTFGSSLGKYVGAYEICKNGVSLANHSVDSSYATPEEAADNALRVAKDHAYQKLDGPFPKEGRDVQQRLHHGGFVFDIQAKGVTDSNEYSPLILVIQTPFALQPSPFPMQMHPNQTCVSTSACMDVGRAWMIEQIDKGNINRLTGILEIAEGK